VEEAATEEVLVPEARAVGSSLERVLDAAAETMVLQGGSYGNRGGRWWCSPVSKSGWATVKGKSRERTQGGESGVKELSLCAHAWDKDGWSMWDGGDRWCVVTAASLSAVSHVRTR
jgi:hypothetical protein